MVMAIVELATQLGEDADLLAVPDSVLEIRRASLASQISRLADELDNVLKAQRLKEQLQNSDLEALLASGDIVIISRRPLLGASACGPPHLTLTTLISSLDQAN